MIQYKKVLILGSAALKIGEAGEFDYSGSQAIEALKEEGIYTILINPNIATIQTSSDLADQVYFLPVTPPFIRQVIEKERPDGLLLSFGGQTALNAGVALYENGTLTEFDVQVLGTPVETVMDTEDRNRFTQRLNEIEVKTARSATATDWQAARSIAVEIGFPVMIRVAYALGGLGSGVCHNQTELEERVKSALAHAPQVLVEEYLGGWKEIEYEIVRDASDNCIAVCNMENFDPVGIHTGESIVVAPSQTLNNHEYHKLRAIGLQVIRHLGVVGECNIQYALDPKSEDYRVIEVNARLSRSSALASKATGYPLAFVAAKLALGYTLPELKNAVTGSTSAFFEPALDYVVVKIPRWDLRKFRRVSKRIGSGMKSVGEVMAIGRHFEEALQKALRMLGTGARGLTANPQLEVQDISSELQAPTENRIFAIMQAFERGFSITEINNLSRIDQWFLHKLKKVHDITKQLELFRKAELPGDLLLRAKQAGFSDTQLALLTGQKAEAIRKLRHGLNIHPKIRQIDTMAGEYPAETNYLYLSYNADQHDLPMPQEKHILILGSGAYHIGSSVEFDWCAVNAVRSLRRAGLPTIILNYNPETVSTDYDESDMLIFDEISEEIIIELQNMIPLGGVLLSMGGQIPNNLAIPLAKAGLPILGTPAEQIDRAENRSIFSTLLDELGIGQPVWGRLDSPTQALKFAGKVGYPVLVRPSYVLSGAAMSVASNAEELEKYLERAVEISGDHPTVISKFYTNAKEIEYDGVAKNGEIVVYAISEHVENAGVHSGDATLVFPPQRLYLETMRRVRQIAGQIAKALQITGPFNIQFIAKNNEVMVIECNLRASRSFPFVSKILGINFIDIAAKVMLGLPFERPGKDQFDINCVGVKAPQFSFTRLEGADPVLGVEMASTGEVGCFGDNFDEAFIKALIAVGYRFPFKSVLLSTGPIESKAELLEPLLKVLNGHVKIYATGGTAKFLTENGFNAEKVAWPLDDTHPSAVDIIRERKVDLVINIPKSFQKEELTNGYLIRRAAVDFGVMLITNRQIAMRLFEALSRGVLDRLQIKSSAEYD